MNRVCDSRKFVLNEHDFNEKGEYVLYWMIATRRLNYNSALQRAIELSEELQKPLLVLEGVSTMHKFASDRIITFMVQGLIQNKEMFERRNIRFIPWVHTPLQSNNGLLYRLAERSAAVVTDFFPTYYPREIIDVAKKKINVYVEAIDSNGIFPMAEAKRSFPTAHSFRKYLHDNFLSSWQTIPPYDPTDVDYDFSMSDESFNSILNLCDIKSTPLEWMWRVSEGGSVGQDALKVLNIDHSVPAIALMNGGRTEALRRLSRFISNGLYRYDTDRNDPSNSAASGLSPWFHFGHISTIEVVNHILELENWDGSFIDHSRRGSRSGWWGLSEPVESFLDQILTWRELGFNFAFFNENHTSIDSIPDWAKKSLNEHINDPRQNYTLEQLENAQTDDELWNAAQRQLRRMGIIHNYLRMIWGKRILEWAPNPETAANWMIQLNDKWALDGRDPNSYTGIFWVMGRHDRAWGPERAIFGKVRYMSSANTAKKLNVNDYLSRWAHDALLLSNYE